jgi:hypothetical protein
MIGKEFVLSIVLCQGRFALVPQVSENLLYALVQIFRGTTNISTLCKNPFKLSTRAEKETT